MAMQIRSAVATTASLTKDRHLSKRGTMSW